MTELAWRVPKLDIVNEIAEREGQVRALQSQQRHSHSLGRGTAGSSPLHTVTSSRGKSEGDQKRDLTSFPRIGEPCAVSGGIEPAPAPQFTRTFPALCLHPWAVPAPSHTAFPGDRTHLGCPGSPRSLLTFSVTHPLQRKTNTAAHIRERIGRSIPWERGRGGCFSHASSQQLALGSLPLGWL